MGGGNLASKSRKKGFAISGILYPLLILTLFLVVQMLFMLQTRKNVLDKVRTELIDSVNLSNKIYSIEELSILIDELNNNFLDKTYPIGSLYISTNSINPKDILGGSWERYGNGRTLVGVNESEVEFATVSKTGGEKTHVLTIDEMAKHNHAGLFYNNMVGDNSYALTLNAGTIGYQISWYGSGGTDTGGAGSGRDEIFTGLSGKSKAHNNLQPYITVYIWKRTA